MSRIEMRERKEMKPVDGKQGQKFEFIIANELAGFQPAAV